MTDKEALCWCDDFATNIVSSGGTGYRYTLALEAMIKCRQALKKQIPQKTILGLSYKQSWRSCPVCHSKIHKTFKFCHQCGQALDFWVNNE